MMKNLSQLESLLDGKYYRFTCEVDAPLHFIKESLFQFQAYVAQVQEAHEQIKKSQETTQTMDDQNG